jgi:hypothetical protein
MRKKNIQQLVPSENLTPPILDVGKALSLQSFNFTFHIFRAPQKKRQLKKNTSRPFFIFEIYLKLSCRDTMSTSKLSNVVEVGRARTFFGLKNLLNKWGFFGLKNLLNKSGLSQA